MAFSDALANTLKYEGGYSDSPSDTGGATIMGISSKWWPDDYATVKNLVDSGDTGAAMSHVHDFYKKNFWDKIGADNLPPQAQTVAFDTAVNNGVGAAQKIIAQTGGDPQAMLDQRQKLDQKIVDNNPKQAANAAGWENRINDLKGKVSAAPQGDHLDQILDQQASVQRPTGQPDHLDDILDNHQAQSSQPQQKPSDIGYRFAQGLQDPLAGMAQLGAHLSSNPDEYIKGIDQAVNKREQDYRQNHDVSGVDWARLAGNILSPANALLPLKAINEIPAASSWATRAGKSALTGIVNAVSQPTETSDQMGYAGGKVRQAGAGAAIGAGLSTGLSALASLVKPQVSADAQKLIDEGVPTSMGQTSGNGMLKSAEDKMTSWPIIGSMIKDAQSNGVKGLNIAAVNRSLAPIGEQLPDNVGAGHEAIQYAQKKLGDEYEKILPQISGDLKAPTTNNFGQNLIGGGTQGAVQPQDFTTKVGNLLQSDYYDMHSDMKEKLGQILKKEIIDRINPDGTFDGNQAKTVESRLGYFSSKYSNSTDSDSRMLADALDDVKSAFRDQMTSANPDAAKRLQSINQGYANFKIAQKAATSVNALNGVFTPAMLHNAVQAADKSAGKGRFANGTALMQDLSEAGKNVLPNKVPDSGTAGRELAAAAAAALAGGGGVALAHPALGAAGAAAAGLYTKPGQALARTAMTARPAVADPLSKLLRVLSDVSVVSPYAH